MRRTPARTTSCLLTIAFVAAACGGGDGGTAPPAVASVVITAPAAPPTLQTLTRTIQFTAVARDATNVTLAGATIGWETSNAAVATVVSGSGLVTAVGNGTTQITARSGGVFSSGVTVTVAQFVAAVNTTPAAVAFGAIGSTRILTAVAVDSSGTAVAGAPAVTWTRAGTGATASVGAGGLATALAVGASDTAVATVSTKADSIPITVTQVVATILVTSTGNDTLRTTGRTKQYTAAVRDSQSNTIPSAGVAWSSSAPSVATVGAGTGLATAAVDGSTNIVATSNAISGQRQLVVGRYADVFTLSPGGATITTPLGTQIFLGTAQDSVATALPIAWVSRSPNIASLSAPNGTQVTATAAANGTTLIVMSAGTRSDSALLTVSGQSTAPLTAGVTIDNILFQSQRNSTQNPAIDTIAVGGTVTWVWNGGTHNVQSTGSPSFTSSTVKSSGNYSFTFNGLGSYEYICQVHGGSMSGRVVVR